MRRRKRFEEAPLENQIDRDAHPGRRKSEARLQGVAARSQALLRELDRGTLLIPDKFLGQRRDRARRRSDLRRRTCCRRSAWCKARALVPSSREADVVAALKKAASDGVTSLQNIRSVGGFERRLNDITCSGCHQTRGIGGFHFPGVDWMAAKPSNSTRRAGFAAFLRRSGPPPRHPCRAAGWQDAGFFPRLFQPPAIARQPELAGTEYHDGWGAHCFRNVGQTGRKRPQFSHLDLRQRARLPARRRCHADGHVLRAGPVVPRD